VIAAVDAIRDAIRTASPEILPALLGQLEEIRAQAWARLLTPLKPSPEPRSEERLLTPEQAAAIAQVPPSVSTLGREVSDGRDGPLAGVFGSPNKASGDGWKALPSMRTFAERGLGELHPIGRDGPSPGRPQLRLSWASSASGMVVGASWCRW